MSELKKKQILQMKLLGFSKEETTKSVSCHPKIKQNIAKLYQKFGINQVNVCHYLQKHGNVE